MASGRTRIRRALQRKAGSAVFGHHATNDGPRRVGRVVIDFSSLSIPVEVSRALADAFWNHIGARPSSSVLHSWRQFKSFARFAAETRLVRGLVDLNGALLARYIEWLNVQVTASGTPWSKITRNAAYGTLRRLLQWIERCRPGCLARIDYPFNPFPWRNRDTRHRDKAGAQDVRALLKACEHDIEQTRAERQCAEEERAAAGKRDADPRESRAALLAHIDRRFGGVLPPYDIVMSRGYYHCRMAVAKYGGRERIERCLYPLIDAIFPYYLAILLHTAGNPEAIARLRCQCLQEVPLLEDRELLVWDKPRAAAPQRRSFRRTAPFEPPTLVREILEWTRRLRPHASAAERGQLFLVNSQSDIRSLARINCVYPLRRFEARHGLKHIALASLRPSVLTSLYRATGDLHQVKAVANHAYLSTTVGYVESPEVKAHNRVRIAALQTAFVGHLERGPRKRDATRATKTESGSAINAAIPPATAVSMFGFGCTDPLAGIAPGTRAGELCSHFLGCFTCPNAIIERNPRTLARLLQARDHLKAAAVQLHPARWAAIYAAPLKILEEEILTRFAVRELAEAERLRVTLVPLPPLR